MRCALTAVLSIVSASASAAVRTGSYVGDGIAGRTIAGLGARPDAVLIKGDGAQLAVVRTASMAGDLAKPLMGGLAPQPDIVPSLDADGFTLGSSALANGTGTTYFWAAFFMVPAEAKVGTYVGTGLNDAPVTGLGFEPDFVVVASSIAQSARVRPSTAPANTSFDFGQGTFLDSIRAFTADGFTVGTGGVVNQPGVAYHYLAWRAIPGAMAVGSYTGDGADNRSIAGLGLTPEYLVIQGPDAAHRTASLTGDASLAFWKTANGSDQIQRLFAGGFEVGTHLKVNQAGSTYHYVAFARDGTDGGPVDAGAVDAGAADAGALDAGGGDAGTADGAGLDGGSSDASDFDAGREDAGGPDAGAQDGGAAGDSGPFADAGPADSGSTDAATDAGGSPDASAVDSGEARDASATLPEPSRDELRLTVGCGCTKSRGAASAALLLALSFVRRRRSRA